MPVHPGVKQFHKFGLHELIVVRNIEADYLGMPKIPFEASCEPVFVRFLHYEDDVCPFQQFWCAYDFSIVIQPGRRDFNVYFRRENLLCGGAAQPVLAA